MWCYLLQDLPNGIRVDGDGDLAPTTSCYAGPQVEVQSGMVCTRGIVTQSHKPRSHQVLQSRRFVRPVVRRQEVCSARFYLSETERPCELDVYSGSTTGHGMCQRTGVGKVCHLELRFLWIQERLRLKAFRLNKETTEEMTACK